MKPLLLAKDFNSAINDLALKISEHASDYNNMAFVGIHTRGVPLAKRLTKIFHDQDKPVLEGLLDINLYRDDLSESSEAPILKETKIDFDVTGKIIYLVDDVLYTGRTIRAAMDAVFDLGRPKSVHLVVMAKRTGRELPIDTDLTALNIKTSPTDNIKVKFNEVDDVDEITLLEKGEY